MAKPLQGACFFVSGYRVCFLIYTNIVYFKIMSKSRNYSNNTDIFSTVLMIFSSRGLKHILINSYITIFGNTIGRPKTSPDYVDLTKIWFLISQLCPGWGEWGEFTPCGRTCGGSIRSRDRRCITDDTRPFDTCPGDSTESVSCNIQVISLAPSNFNATFFEFNFCFALYLLKL